MFWDHEIKIKYSEIDVQYKPSNQMSQNKLNKSNQLPTV